MILDANKYQTLGCYIAVHLFLMSLLSAGLCVSILENDSLFQYLENKAYEEELKRYEDKERADLDKARLKAQEAVSH